MLKKASRWEWGFTHVVIPGMVPVVDDGSPKAPSWVDAGASDGDGGQVDQEHREPNRQRGEDLFSQTTDGKMLRYVPKYIAKS